MTFRRINAQQAESDTGTVVRINRKQKIPGSGVKADMLQYMRSGRLLELFMEFTAPRKREQYRQGAVIYVPILLHWQSLCTDPIDPLEQLRILEEIDEALAVLGIESRTLPR